MFKNPGHYFFSISFEWRDLYRILDVPEAEWEDFVLVEKYRYQSPNANSTDGLGINEGSALFEYYIMPNSLRNGEYSYSSIYDQQLKRFFESPNINYGPVLKNSKKKDYSVICLFNKNIVNGKSGFAVCFSGGGKWKTVIFLFDEKYLNLTDAHTQWGEQIPFQAVEISSDEKGDSIVKEITIDPKLLWINTGVQSQDDAQSSPFSSDLHRFFKK